MHNCEVNILMFNVFFYLFQVSGRLFIGVFLSFVLVSIVDIFVTFAL
jgi:hypothetical protein